jgi:DnaJ-class molecular chaperone
MSTIKNVIEINPPSGNTMEEVLRVFNQPCPSCNGRGFHIEYQGKEQVMKSCKRCDGTGKLQARIEINWSADFFGN